MGKKNLTSTTKKIQILFALNIDSISFDQVYQWQPVINYIFEEVFQGIIRLHQVLVCNLKSKVRASEVYQRHICNVLCQRSTALPRIPLHRCLIQMFYFKNSM